MELSDKIKALGWAVFQLVAYNEQFNYIVCDKSGLIKLLIETPYIREDKNCWASERLDRCEIIHTTEHLAGTDNWRELCFSREECEAWTKENINCTIKSYNSNVVVAKNATTSCSELSYNSNSVCKKNLQAQPVVKEFKRSANEISAEAERPEGRDGTKCASQSLHTQPVVKGNLTTQTFTLDELDRIRGLASRELTSTNRLIIAKCNELLKGGDDVEK